MFKQLMPPKAAHQDDLLEVRQLSVQIDQQTVLSDINLTIRSGEVTALLGPNGAGKSTLLKSLCHEVTPTCGDIQIYGKPLTLWDRQQLAQSLGVLPQHASLTFPFTAEEVVAMGLYPLSLSHQQGQAIVEQQLNHLALQHLKQRRYPSLSGGEKQRVQLARVLTQLAQSPRPPILLLDEPTSALDLAQQHRVLSIAKALAHQQGYAVIVVLHDLNQASRYADRLVILEQGHIVRDGAPRDTLTAATVRQVWHYDPLIVQSPDHSTTLLF
ncbi:heme ABC transporter ATP-binding protein [Shewanella algidipiscicola]|uniref:Hemin import ATP-binding protein HmuV n=1 Tax=Shewanella algidipiscicola TaxID=614070 RepID=A0ABQ4PIZ5_9GAMM|nr:heme ABC transporter ATP-binding protein [Shewanella algidipiscicola]GIU47507.1 hemin import ATP-binding protein HmuV [Shewanella algidipiscicola]